MVVCQWSATPCCSQSARNAEAPKEPELDTPSKGGILSVPGDAVLEVACAGALDATALSSPPRTQSTLSLLSPLAVTDSTRGENTWSTNPRTPLQSIEADDELQRGRQRLLERCAMAREKASARSKPINRQQKSAEMQASGWAWRLCRCLVGLAMLLTWVAIALISAAGSQELNKCTVVDVAVSNPGYLVWPWLLQLAIVSFVGTLYLVSNMTLAYAFNYIIVIWITSVIRTLKYPFLCLGMGTANVWYQVDMAMYLLLMCRFCLACKLFIDRLATVGHSMRRNLGAKFWHRMVNAWIVWIAIVLIVQSLHQSVAMPDAIIIATTMGGNLAALVMVGIHLGLCVCFYKAIAKLSEVIKATRDTHVESEAHNARKELRKQVLVFWLNFVVACLAALANQLVGHGMWRDEAIALRFVDISLDVSVLVLLTGMHRVWDYRSPGQARERRRRQVIREGLPKVGDDEEERMWHEKVEELAGRGFTLRVLLEFWRGLGEDYMDTFVPSQHTTTDVVRGAIIPLSSHRSCALAELLMDGQSVRPQKLVTHNWGNKFRDSLAVIFADALGETEFNIIATLLESDVDSLEGILEDAGALDMAVWFCAISVNQHAGICGANPHRSTDTVTGIEHPVCACGRDKFFNTTPPLRSDGKSCACEMNKFDDVLASLAMDPTFEQLVAVDSSFEVFSRAWCISEVAKAHSLGMKTRLIVCFRALVAKYKDSLYGLRVENMEATRPEDVQEILDQIPDKEAFNRQLQHLLFDPREGCFYQWERTDSLHRMHRTGRLVRWNDVRGKNQGFWANVKARQSRTLELDMV